MNVDKLLCWLIGHRLTDLDVKKRTASCSRCIQDFNVSYDICYGGAYFVSIIDKEESK